MTSNYNTSVEERKGPLSLRHRGWVCRSCHTLLKWIDEISAQKLFYYLDRCVALGDKVPEYPGDNCCDLCKSSMGTRRLSADCPWRDHPRGSGFRSAILGTASASAAGRASAAHDRRRKAIDNAAKALVFVLHLISNTQNLSLFGNRLVQKRAT